jgi:prepilin-type processing-associated H-X9-DG protein
VSTYIGPGRPFGGLHHGSGANVAFADGSVRFISQTIDPRVFEAVSTISGGKKVPRDVWSR